MTFHQSLYFCHSNGRNNSLEIQLKFLQPNSFLKFVAPALVKDKMIKLPSNTGIHEQTFSTDY